MATTEEDVRRICLGLPDVVEVTYERLPGFRVRKRLFARIRQKPDALVVMRPHVDEKRALIASAPDKLFETPHYEGHHAVLVRMEAIDVEELEELLTESWILTAPAKLVAGWDGGSRGRQKDQIVPEGAST